MGIHADDLTEQGIDRMIERGHSLKEIRSVMTGVPFVAGSITSMDAARALLNTATLKARVYRELVSRGREGGTDEELQMDLAMSPNTQRPRRVELVRQGFVEDSGMTRKTQARRDAVVWRVARVKEDQGELAL